MEAFNKKVEMIKVWLAVSMCVFGCLLIIAGFIVVPTGQIHDTVLIAFGEVLTFAGALFGISQLYSVRHKQLEMSIQERLSSKEKDEEK